MDKVMNKPTEPTVPTAKELMEQWDKVSKDCEHPVYLNLTLNKEGEAVHVDTFCGKESVKECVSTFTDVERMCKQLLERIKKNEYLKYLGRLEEQPKSAISH